MLTSALAPQEFLYPRLRFHYRVRMDASALLPYDDPAIYDLRTAGLRDDVQVFLREAARCGGPILELACGTGRVAVPLAMRGSRVIGLDIDRAMLDRARANAARAGVDLPLVRADMTRFSFRNRFRLVYVAFASLHDLPSLSDWEACFRCVREALEPDGTFVMDEHPAPLPTGDTPHHFQILDLAAGRAIDGFHTLEVDERELTTRGAITYVIGRADGTRDVQRFPFQGTFADRPRIEAMMARAGLCVKEVQGDYAGGAWREGSPRMVFRAVRV